MTPQEQFKTFGFRIEHKTGAPSVTLNLKAELKRVQDRIRRIENGTFTPKEVKPAFPVQFNLFN